MLVIVDEINLFSVWRVESREWSCFANSECGIQFAIRNAQCAIICEVVLYLNDNSLCSVKNCGRECWTQIEH